VAAGGYSVNMDKWNELPDDIKRAWELVTIKHAYRDAKSIQVVRDNESLQKMLDYGVVRTQLPIEDWLTINALGLDVAESWAAKSDLANEVITSIFDFKKALGKM
jgi:TRAP-type mannitol/chloroaromatic compound transport system substrate-binding protein